MRNMSSDEIRRTFLEFYQERGHLILPSSSLVNQGDPTLLLVNAGMVPLKPYFLGTAVPPSRRATSVQKCFRTTDIDSVGNDRNLTFFEMMGNFSFGDYFKKDAIAWCWELYTQYFGIPADRLYPSIHPDDKESPELWVAVGVPESRLTYLTDNWWPADTTGWVGPTGPDSELYYDRGPGLDGEQPGDEGERFLEMGNNVFMQYNQAPDGTRTPLPRPSIDTGWGLERAAMILQGKNSVYETDLYMPLMERAGALVGKRYTHGEDRKNDFSLRVIADHSRAVTFLIADGVLPGNEGRGYILRRVLRRAVRYGRMLGIEEPFMARMADEVIERMGNAYPELHEKRDFIKRVIELEEGRFSRTLIHGLDLLEEIIDNLKGSAIIPGDEAFRLKDTYGFPIELTREIARERGLEVDEQAYNYALERGRQISQVGAKERFHAGKTDRMLYESLTVPETVFLGYETTSAPGRIVALLHEGESVESVSAEHGSVTVEVVLDRTPFYAESGGQVADTGTIIVEAPPGGTAGRIVVEDVQRPIAGMIVQRGQLVEGVAEVGATVESSVDTERRRDIMRNHTATHLLHKALRKYLGTQVHQAGSLVAPDRLRFDFTHIQPVSKEELDLIEREVNEAIRDDFPVATEITSYSEAVEKGAMALFGEKYGETVRLLDIGEGYSRELCGGTHCHDTGEIGFFQITSEGSVSAGVRRIEAVTGRGAESYVDRHLNTLQNLARELQTTETHLPDRIQKLLDELAEQRREVQRLQRQLSQGSLDALLANVQQVGDVKVLAAVVDASNMEQLRSMGDWLRDKIKSGIVVLGALFGERPSFLAMVTPDLIRRYNAGKIVNAVAQITGGRGGGQPGMAQAGGRDASKLDEAIAAVPNIVQSEQLK